MRAVQGGAQDCMRKEEAQPSILLRSVSYAIERHRLLDALRSLSLIDGLTDLYNRRGFNDLGEQYLKLALRSSRSVSLIYLDIDRFKTINDTLGHHVGDRALLCVADTLRDTFRRSDIVARMSGDEFAVLAFETSEENAETLVERLRTELRELNETTRERFQLSVSIGLARNDGDSALHLDELLKQADAAMYQEKRGKSRGPSGNRSRKTNLTRTRARAGSLWSMTMRKPGFWRRAYSRRRATRCRWPRMGTRP